MFTAKECGFVTIELDRRVHELLGYCVHENVHTSPIGVGGVWTARTCVDCCSMDDMLEIPRYSSDLNLAWPLLNMIRDKIGTFIFFNEEYGIQFHSTEETAERICEKFVEVMSHEQG